MALEHQQWIYRYIKSLAQAAEISSPEQLARATARACTKCDRSGDDGRKLVNRITSEKGGGNRNSDCIKIMKIGYCTRFIIEN